MSQSPHLSRFSLAALATTLSLTLLPFGCAQDVTTTPFVEASTDQSDSTEGSDSWTTPAPPVDFDAQAPLKAGFLVVNGVFNSELMAPYDIFQHTIFHTQPGIEVFVVSEDGLPITTFEGIQVVPHYSFETAPELDILVVPSAEHSMDSDLENEPLMAWVKDVGARARFLLSLCDGAFVLAHAGLLDGHAVTTFPGDQDRFAETFPDLDLRRGVSFVHDGKTFTSAGGAKSYDVAMYLVAHLYGDGVAKGVGGGLIIDWPPKPGTVAATLITP